MPLKPFFHEAREIARLAHKARCVALANGFVGLCKTKGADVVVFGSLANKDAFFRVDSDIDLCILDRNTRQTSPFRAGKDSAGAAGVLVLK